MRKTKKAKNKLVRRTRTENDVKTFTDKLFNKYGANPFGLDNKNPKASKATKSAVRTVFKFRKEFKKLCERYPNVGLEDANTLWLIALSFNEKV